LEFLMAIIDGAKEVNAPVIVETTEGAMKFAGSGDPARGARIFVHMVKEYAEDTKIPVALHLDHGKHLEFVMAAIRAGYSSVMMDASACKYDENLKITSDVVKFAHAANVSVEAELGTLKGIEDNVEGTDSILVNPKEAEEFVRITGVDFLAPAVGTSHGAFKFKGAAKIDYDRIEEVKKLTGKPLVLHGASSVPEKYTTIAEKYGADFSGAKGVPEDVLIKSVQKGINKVNTDTDLRMAFTAGLREYLTNNPKDFDPRKYYTKPMEYVKEVVVNRSQFLGAAGKA
jgi:fructose-bisphosphate aldolase class II